MQQHVTVLKTEAIEALALKPSFVVVDATVGSGGHTTQILNILDESGIFIGIDADQTALDALEEVSKSSRGTAHLVCRNFREIDKVLASLNLECADAILADLGWRMEQFESGGKGFSFRVDEPLLMTYGDPEKYAFTAHDIVNTWAEGDIKNVIKGYGEERFAWRIAQAIVVEREKSIIATSVALAHIIENAVPGFYKRGKVHPATRTFQALRIAVNDELDALQEFLDKAIGLLSPGGRLAVIAFHSLEDRIVKRTFKAAGERMGTLITKKPIYPTHDEIGTNPRARSAKLRIFEKVHELQNKKNGIS